MIVDGEKHRRIPVFASFSDIGRNVGNRYMSGFHLADGDFSRAAGSYFKGSNNIKSVGGVFSSTIGMAALGASIGAGTFGFAEQNPIAGAAIGGTIGALALPTAGLVSKGAVNIGKSAYNAIRSANGASALSMGAGALSVASKVAAPIGAVGMVAGAQALNMMTKISDIAIKNNPLDISFNGKLSDVKMTKAGKGILLAGSLASGVKKAMEEVTNIRMGQKDNYVSRATPQMPNYVNELDNAGATGDLVFALNNLRRG